MELETIHSRSLVKSAMLTGFQVMKAISPLEVIAILNQNRISFILVGAYGLAGWRQSPRATEDVDLVIAAKQQKKAAKILLKAFPHLEAVELEVVTRLRVKNSEDVAIDLMKPQGLYREAFKHATAITDGAEEYRIPTLEMALAMKFAALVSMMRADEKKYIDAGDFFRIVKVNAHIDLSILEKLGEVVYAGGGKELLEMVRKVRAGEKIQI